MSLRVISGGFRQSGYVAKGGLALQSMDGRQVMVDLVGARFTAPVTVFLKRLIPAALAGFAAALLLGMVGVIVGAVMFAADYAMQRDLGGAWLVAAAFANIGALAGVLAGGWRFRVSFVVTLPDGHSLALETEVDDYQRMVAMSLQAPAES